MVYIWISLGFHTISIKKVELYPFFSGRQRVVYDKRGTLAVVRLGFELLLLTQ